MATTIGEQLRRHRRAAGLTQEALAERAGLSARAISDLERGLSLAPRYETLDLLARALGLSAEQRAELFAAARPELLRTEPHAPPASLPIPPAPLLGREPEIAAAESLLRDRGARLITVTGPGGVGKTHFALELAGLARGRYPDGAVWIDLTTLRDPALVPQSLAQALGLSERARQGHAERAIEHLAGRRTLLLLDNVEHVLGAAEFVGRLLASCPGVDVLATSRAPLRLRAEHQLALGPLPPEAAAELFLGCARRAQPDIEGEPAIVLAICEQLSNLPLAIELAAAHVRALPLPTLLARLSNRLALLRGGPRDLPARQQTMREAVGWSYHLLAPTEQAWFRALGAFAGGCTLAAAEAVVGGSGDGLAAVAALVDASLIQRDASADPEAPRYRMLDVIREYAAEQLRARGEEAPLRRRHAAHYAALAEEIERGGAGQGSRESLLLQETANGRAALAWALESGEAELGLRLATWFGRLWLTRGQMREGEAWLGRMLALDDSLGRAAGPAVRARALYWDSRLAMHLGRPGDAERRAREALALARSTGDEADISALLAMLGTLALAAGRPGEAAESFAESSAAAARAGDLVAVSLALLNLGELARARGELAEAGRLFAEALACLRRIDMTWGIANTLTLLGHLARDQRRPGEAAARYRESLALYRRLGNATYAAWCIEGVAALAGDGGRHRDAARLCGAAAALRAAAETPMPPGEQEAFDRLVMTVRAEAGGATFDTEWRAGSAASLDGAIADALQQLGGSRA